MQQEVVRTLVAMAPNPYQQSYQQQIATQATYQMSPATGLPINTAAGTVETEFRGVHISNLSFRITEQDLKKLIKKFARPERIVLKKDGNGRSKGSAVVTMKNGNDAATIVSQLNHFTLKGFELKVKLDREAATQSAATQGPLIANGSTST